MALPKGLTTKWAQDRQFVGYWFRNKLYKTQFMLNRAWRKKAGTDKHSFEATPLYKK